MIIDLQRFAEGEPTPEPTPTPEPSPASTDWAKMLFDDKGSRSIPFTTYSS